VRAAMQQNKKPTIKTKDINKTTMLQEKKLQ
jgi:hypothetical protein